MIDENESPKEYSSADSEKREGLSPANQLKANHEQHDKRKNQIEVLFDRKRPEDIEPRHVDRMHIEIPVVGQIQHRSAQIPETIVPLEPTCLHHEDDEKKSDVEGWENTKSAPQIEVPDGYSSGVGDLHSHQGRNEIPTQEEENSNPEKAGNWFEMIVA